jgi:hypothetical protein
VLPALAQEDEQAIEDGHHVGRAFITVEAKGAAELWAPGGVGIVDRRDAVVGAPAAVARGLGLQSRAELVRYALDSGLFGGEAGSTA